MTQNKKLSQEEVEIRTRVLFLANELKLREKEIISHIFEIYLTIPNDLKNIDYLREKIKSKHPKLFDRRITHPTKK